MNSGIMLKVMDGNWKLCSYFVEYFFLCVVTSHYGIHSFSLSLVVTIKCTYLYLDKFILRSN